VQIKLVFY